MHPWWLELGLLYLIASRMPPGQVSSRRESRSLQKEGPEGSQWSPKMEDVLARLGLVLRPPGGSLFVPRGVRNGHTEASWGFLGPRSASGGHFGRLWAEKGESTNCMDGSWGHLGALLAALGPVLGRLSHPWEEARGVSGKSFLKFFSEVTPRAPQIVKSYRFFPTLL